MVIFHRFLSRRMNFKFFAACEEKKKIPATYWSIYGKFKSIQEIYNFYDESRWMLAGEKQTSPVCTGRESDDNEEIKITNLS